MRASIKSWSFERRLLIASVAVWTAIAVATLALGAPLGHDEAAFAVCARGDVQDWLYRSRGVVALARLGILAGGAEWQLRLPIAIINATVVLAVFVAGRAVFGATAGAWAAAVIAGAHWMVLRSTELLGDLPATACVVAAVALVVSELDRGGGPRWRLVLAAPLLAGAFYVRYGTLPVIAAAGGAALLLWWRAILRRPGPALAATALFAVLLVPHVLASVAATGRALGILELSRATPYRLYVGDGLVTYLTSNPLRFYGALVALLALAGLLGVVRARRRAPLYLWLVATGQILAIGLSNHGQPRYIFIATALLVVLGAGAVRSFVIAGAIAGVTAGAIAGREVLLRRCALGLVIAAWIGAAAAVVPLHRVEVRSRALMRIAAETLRRDAAGAPCTVAAQREPQLAWYSGCAPMMPPDPAAAAQGPLPVPYVVVLPGSPMAHLTEAAEQTRGVPSELPTGTAARVWQLAR